MALDNSGYTNLLLKKYLGKTQTDPSLSYSLEAAGNARTKIISNLQLYSNPIPNTAPSISSAVIKNNSSRNGDFPKAYTSGISDLSFTGYVTANGGIDKSINGDLGIVYTSNTYPWIQYIQDLALTQVVEGKPTAYRFSNPASSNNILANAIPFSYDQINNTYTHYVYTNGIYKYNNSVLVEQSNYIVDCDAGYLYFVNNNWANGNTPYISFYRYNGTIGIPTNIGNFAGAYFQGTGAIAYGDSAGYTGQRANALAIGNFAGAYGQGTGSIAIGYLAGPTGMSANSIVLNASGTALAGTGPTGGFYVAPVASYSGSMGPFTLLAYGADKQIVSVTGDALTAMNIVGGGGGANYNIGNDIILSGATGGVPTRPVENDDGGFYVSPVLGYTGSSSTTFNVLGYGSSDKEVITLPITLNTKDVLTPMTINNNLQLPTLATGNLTYINNSGLLSSTDVTVAQLVNMSGVNPTNSIAIGNGAGQINQGANSIAIGNGAGADISGLSNGTYTNWLKPSVVANNNITGVAMSANGQTRFYALNFISKQWIDSVTIYKSNDILYNSNQLSYYYVKIDGAISSAPSGTSDTNSYAYINLYSANLNLSNSQYVSYLNTIYKISVTGITLANLPTVTYDVNYSPSLSIGANHISGDVTLTYIGDTTSQRRPTSISASPRTGAFNSNGYITINYNGNYYNGILWSENMYIPFPSDVTYILQSFINEGDFRNRILAFNVYSYTISKNSYTLNNPPSFQNWPQGVSVTPVGYLPTLSTTPNIYKSIDSGSTFLSISSSVFPVVELYNYVVSGDGKCIIAFIQKTGVTNFYISRDGGISFPQPNGRQNFPNAPLAFAISNTGDYIMCVSTNGIYVTNSTSLIFAFQLISPPPSISTALCAMSYNGRYMIAIANRSTLYTSSNHGKTFTVVTPSGLPTSNLSLLAISGTGSTYLIFTTNGLYVSTNMGGSFSPSLSDPSITVISSIAVSQTGQYMIACCSNSSVKGYVYYSTNYGANASWYKMMALGLDNFNSCSISADGALITVSTPSDVYTLNNNLIGNTVAIGNLVGQTNQSANSVAIGNGAGQTNQAANSVAIGNGAGQTNQPANTIVINASGTALNPITSNGCYIAPIADASNSSSFNLLGYGSDNQVVKSSVVLINSTGIGINNNNPTCALDLSGDMRINGNFGIGTSDGQTYFPLHVVSTAIPGSNGASYYFNYGNASISPNSTWLPVTYGVVDNGRSAGGIYSIGSIITYGSIVATISKSLSDFRIKKNIQTRTGLLNIIDKLRIVSYDHIDPTKGTVSAGIIAQEVASIDPASVMSHSEALPNIFTGATHAQLENGMIHIVVEYTQSVDITEGATVRLIIQKTDSTTETSYDNTIVNLTANSFDIKAWDRYESSDNIFVYGTKVQNFLTVDKVQLSMIALGALKELYQHVKVLQAPDITIGNRTDSTDGNFKLVYDSVNSNLVIGSSVNGFVNKQFVMHQNAPANSLLITADGTVYNNGTLVSSDRRIKTDIDPISDEECLAKINRLNVVKYNYTNPALNGANKVIGFIAQEVREAIPEAVDITTKNIYWSNAFSFTVGQSNTTVDSTYSSLTDKDGKTYTITNGVVYDASNTAVFYFRENMLISVHSTPTRDTDGKLLYSTSTTYDLSKDDTYVLHTHSVYKQTDVTISVATVDVIVGNIVRFVYNSKKYEGVVMTVDTGANASTLKVVTPDIFVNGTLQTYEKVIQDFHMLSKEKIFALTVGAIQDLTTANTALKTQVGSLQTQVGTLQTQVGSLQSQLSSLMNWATSQGFTGASA